MHLRRIEHLEEGVDFIFLSDYKSIAAYDAYARSYRFKGRELEFWRKAGITLDLQGKSQKSRLFMEKNQGTYSSDSKVLG